MGKDRLIVLNRERSKLPYELPPNLVYWIRCETRFKDADTVLPKATKPPEGEQPGEATTPKPVITEGELQ
jgi:hypothetical protein